MNLSQSHWPGGYVALSCLALTLGCQTPRVANRTLAPPPSAASNPRPSPRGDLTRAAQPTPAGRAATAVASNSSGRSATANTVGPVLRRLPPTDTAGGTTSSVRLTGLEHHLQQVVAADDPFGGQHQLELPRLVDEVLARNRTLEAMRATWQSAAARYPQARALDDPVLMSMLAPGSLNSGIAGIPGNSAGYLVGGTQKLPWIGKRPLRGEVALDESRAARWNVENARLEITEAAGLAYYDYYLVRQNLALNVENAAKLHDYRDIAEAQYIAKKAPQQDMLQAEVELAELARRQIELERMERIAIARLNTLMHRPPDAYLPPPPARLDSPPLALSVGQMRATAVMLRPDLAALGAQIRAEQGRLNLAYKEFYPDFEVFGRYDNFWSQASLRGQVGLNMNVPLYREKRYAMVREAQWRLSQRRAEYEQRIDDINREVQTAYERFDEAQQTVGLYTDQILPAARRNVDSAFAAYETSGGDFLRLVAAQRQLIMLRERYQESIADYHRRRVELERVVGERLPGGQPD